MEREERRKLTKRASRHKDFPQYPPLSGASLFVDEKYDKYQKNNPNAPDWIITKACYNEWNKLNEEEQETYVQRQRQLQAQYTVAVNNYLEDFKKKQEMRKAAKRVPG